MIPPKSLRISFAGIGLLFCSKHFIILVSISFKGISAQVEKQSIVLFPFAVSSDVAPDKAEYTALYAEDLSKMINDGFTESKRFSVYEYSPRIANIQRAVKEQKTVVINNELKIAFTEDEVKKPIDTSFAGTIKAQKLAEIIGIGCAVTGSIDRYEFQEDNGEAQLTVTLQFIDVANGKVKSAFTATGRASRDTEKKNQSEIAIGISATQDAAKKLLTDIGATKPEEIAVIQVATDKSESQPSVHKKKGLLPAMILAAILGFALGGG